MNTLRQGSNEPDVILLQTYLGLETDGIFGAKTKAAVISYQKLKGLGADGICGAKTWEALIKDNEEPSLDNFDYEFAAKSLNVPVATVRAVTEVESSGRGFEKNRRPRCLFEGHIFWSQLKKRSIDPIPLSTKNPNILYQKWDRSKYLGGEKEWDRLTEAWKINSSAALESASLGLFQIMGFNYKACGCNSVYEYYSRSFQSEAQQLILFCNFCKSQGLDKYLREKNWAEFAKRYNGPGYAQNQYDKKIAEAYKKYK